MNDNYRLVLNGDTYTLEYRTGSYTGTTEQINTVLDMILADLTDKGYGDFEIRSSGDLYTISAVNGRVTREFKWDSDPDASSNAKCALITVNGKTGMFRADGTVGVDEAAKKLGIAAGDIGKHLMYEDNGVEKYLPVTSTIIPISDGVEYEVGYYAVTYTNSGTAGDTWTYTADTYVKNGDSVTVTANHSLAQVGTSYHFESAAGSDMTFDKVEGTETAADGSSEFTFTVSGLTTDGTIKIWAS